MSLIEQRRYGAIFFVADPGFFFDKRLDGTYVMEEGTEACIPLWAGIATEEQAGLP